MSNAGQVKTWRDFMPEGRKRVEVSKLRWRDPRGLVRMEDPPKPDEGGGDKGGKQGDPPKIDPNSPEVRAAVAKATQDAVAAARTEWEKETEGLRAKRDELLGLQTKLKTEMEELRQKHVADKIGAKPEEFTAAVEEAAQRKFEALKREHSELVTAKDTKIGELDTEVKRLSRQVHRAFIAQEVARASIPPEHRLIHDGAEPQLIDRLEEAVVEQKIDGLPWPVARIKVNGVFQPSIGVSQTPDGLMDMRELLDLMRQGKGPIPDAAWYFRSTGQGSGTVTPGGNNGATGGDWTKMTPEQRAKYTSEHGVAAAKALMEKASAPAAGAAR